MPNEQPSFVQSEPVAIGEALRLLLLAIFPLLDVFNVVHLSGSQMAAIITFYGAVSLVIAIIVRSRVTAPATVTRNQWLDKGAITIIEIAAGLIAIAVLIWIAVTLGWIHTDG